MPKKNNPGCSCCPAECQFFLDEFTRADDDDPGADWDEVSGDWDIVSNAVSTPDDDAVLICLTEHPEATPDISVTAEITISTNNDIARIILDYTDTDNYWFAEVKAGTGSFNAYLRIYQRAGGVNTQRAGLFITRTTGTFVVCASIRGTSIEARTGNYQVSYDGSFSEPVFGIGTGTTTGTIAFTTVSASKTSDICPPCGQSCTSCSTGEGPGQLKVVIPTGTYEWLDNAVNGCLSSECDNADGTYFLNPAWGVSAGALPTFDGGHVNNASQCAYAICVESDCAEPRNAVCRAIMAIIDTSSSNTRLRVVLSNDSHLIARDGGSGEECQDNYFNLADGRYTKTYSGIVDCSLWENEVIAFSSRTFTTNTDVCRPATTSSIEVTSIA